MDNETWLPVLGYENLYEVSNMGRVLSLEKSCPRKDNKGFTRYPRKLMKQKLTKRGYLEIVLCKESKRKTLKVHRLVAAAFVEGESLERNQVNHIDAVKTNNHFANLEWVSGFENMRHAYTMGLTNECRIKGRFAKKDAA